MGGKVCTLGRSRVNGVNLVSYESAKTYLLVNILCSGTSW